MAVVPDFGVYGSVLAEAEAAARGPPAGTCARSGIAASALPSAPGCALIVLALVVVMFVLAVGTSYLYAWYLEAGR